MDRTLASSFSLVELALSLLAKAQGASAMRVLPSGRMMVRVKTPSGRRWVPHTAPEVQQHISEHLHPIAEEAHDRAKAHLEKVLQGLNVQIGGRIKEPYKVAEKMGRPGKQPRHFNRLGDTVGLRVTVHDPAHFEEAHRRLKSLMDNPHPHLKVLEHEVHDGSRDGYRSVHFNGIGHKGQRLEVQLRHPWQNVWADHAHDNFYKDDNLRKLVPAHEREAVKREGVAYMKQVSDHLHANGGKIGPDFPKAPPRVKKYGLEFPAHKLQN